MCDQKTAFRGGDQRKQKKPHNRIGTCKISTSMF